MSYGEAPGDAQYHCEIVNYVFAKVKNKEVCRVEINVCDYCKKFCCECDIGNV